MPSPTDALTLARTRQVFRFLKAFAERNLPARRTLSEHEWSLRLAELPAHAAVEVGVVEMAASASPVAPDAPVAPKASSPPLADEPAADAPLLRVTRPRLTEPPAPPESVAPWLPGRWDDAFSPPEPEPTRSRPAARPNDPPTIERFEDVPARVADLAAWRTRWQAWAQSERPAREAMRVFEALFGILGRIERDSERVELVLGDGLLRRESPGGPIDHPVLLQRVELEFDPSVPEFRVIDADRGPELYGAVLVGEDALSGDRLHALQRELEDGGFHPLAAGGTSGFLRRIAALLGPSATYADAPDAGADGAPRLARDPVLFLRQRASGWPAAFERVLEHLRSEPEVPAALARIVGVETAPAAEDGAAPLVPWGEPADVLFSKPANTEQVEIARALQRHGAVIVQGPPGTGKSHTIANLVGHLVAEGQRVLVTSHTTKALRVLREHVVEELRPLCVALLDQDLEGRAQLEAAVRGIAERLTVAQEPQLLREIEALSASRAKLVDVIARLSDNLRAAREVEYLPVVAVEGEEGLAPADAAREVARGQAAHAWLPGPLEPQAPLPLSEEELRALFRSNAELTPAEEDELARPLPGEDALLTPDAFRTAVEALAEDRPSLLGRFWSRAVDPADEPLLDRLSELHARLLADLDVLVPWQRALVAAGREGGVERAAWLKLRDQVREAAAHAEAARRVLLDHDVDALPADPTPATRETVAAIRDHVRAGHSLGAVALLRHRSWKPLLKSCVVDGGEPATAEHFEALLAHLDAPARRQGLARRWDTQAVSLGLPPLDSLPHPPEGAAAEYVERFEPLLDWWDTRFGVLALAMRDAGLNWKSLHEDALARAAPAPPLERDVAVLRGPLTDLVLARSRAIRRCLAEDALAEFGLQLAEHEGATSRALREAVRRRDVPGYVAGLDALRALRRKQALFAARREALARLAPAAPAWAAAIRARQGAHGAATAPESARDAWRWRQLHGELERRAALDEREIARQVHQRRTELREVTVRLIDRRAWLAQLRRTDLAARQALIGWADTQKKIGKGTGKRVPELQARAREQLAAARSAVPVWIMPLARVAESFDPRKTRFDVVIVDEASQSDVTGLLAFYAADRVVVVGDHEQVSPSAVGQAIADVRALIAEHLEGIPNAHLYDGQTSIYDLARQAFGGTLALHEHFRCVPDIIEFSNRLSYGGLIRPLRDPASAPRPHVAELLVPASGPRSAGPREGGRVNPEEARWCAALLGAMASMREYAGKSLGAISLVGEEQAWEIQRLVLETVDAVELQKRRFAAGNAAQFQGDERDVMVLSMVDRPSREAGAGEPLRLRDEMLFKQRFNVAASRARDQLWLVHSLDPARDLQPTDLRRRLIEHVRDPAGARRARQAARRTGSPFEREVGEALSAAGFQVTPQVEVGRYRMDMIVSDGRQQVAVECDGDRFLPTEQLDDDLARQAVLERAGWRFVRVRSTRWFRDREGTLRDLVADVVALGLRRGARAPEPAADDGREAVLRRATEIMRQRGWLPLATPAPTAAGKPPASKKSRSAAP